MGARWPGRFWPVVAVGLLIAAGGAVAWTRLGDDIAFLAADGTAQWIVYPTPFNPVARPAVELDATFRKSFTVTSPEPHAALSVRMFRTGVVTVNGEPLAPASSLDWKTRRTVDVSRLLHAGENEIAVSVTNAQGPPALWLVLESPQGGVVSDESWEVSWAGGSWAAAIPASTSARRATLVDAFSLSWRPVSALRGAWSRLALFGALALGLVLGLSWWMTRATRRGRDAWRLLSTGSLIAAALLWTVLILHNTQWLHGTTGYDAPGHLEYIDYIQQHHSLPFADQGWSMHHPPLYHLALARALGVTGLSTRDPAGIAVIRSVNLLLGIANLALVLAALRLIFPDQPRQWVAGFLFAALLPANLYLHQYPTNEILMAALASASIYVALRLIRRPGAPLREYAWLGVILGAAMLAKLTALLVVAVVLATLIGRAVAARGADGAGPRLGAIGLTVLVCLSLSGWYYALVWKRFGKPFVAAWDPVSTFRWWQDPGYRTVQHYLSFGEWLRHPIFDIGTAIWGGYWATLWGDGLCGGAPSAQVRPPWSYDLMAAGYLLAIAPAIAIGVGFVAAVVRTVRERDPAWLLLLGMSLATLAAMLSLTLEVPSYSVVKGFFGLPALIPLCAMGALGIDVLSRGRRPIWAALMCVMVTWGANSYATYWIHPDSPDTRLLKAQRMFAAGQSDEGSALLRSALEGGSRDGAARVAAAQLALQRNDPTEAGRLLELPPGTPDTAARHHLLSILAYLEGRPAGAMDELDRAILLDPNDARLHVQRAALLQSRGDLPGAVQAYRDALRIEPFAAQVHARLASLYDELDQHGLAVRHRGYADRLTAATARSTR
jgi:hypothetical protein